MSFPKAGPVGIRYKRDAGFGDALQIMFELLFLFGGQRKPLFTACSHFRQRLEFRLPVSWSMKIYDLIWTIATYPEHFHKVIHRQMWMFHVKHSKTRAYTCPSFFMCMSNADVSDGRTPEMRPACPKVLGLK